MPWTGNYPRSLRRLPCGSSHLISSHLETREGGSVPTPVQVGTLGQRRHCLSGLCLSILVSGCSSCQPLSLVQASCLSAGQAVGLFSGVSAFCPHLFQESTIKGRLGERGTLGLRWIPRDLGGVPWAPSPPCGSFWDL